MKVEYQINKILNHNTILVLHLTTAKEYLLIGKGIGFKRKIGDQIENNANIEKTYEVKADNDIINNNEIEVIAKIISSKLESYLGCDYDHKIYTSLFDHLSFSLYRYKNKIPVSNFFAEEISFMYSEAFEFAKEMIEAINDALNIRLPEVEIGFVCSHVHAALSSDSLTDTVLYATMIVKCLQFIEKETKIVLKDESIEKQRLITHLKFAFKRVKDKIVINNDAFSDSIKKNFPQSYKIAMSLSEMIEKEFNLKLLQAEIGYLTLHIQNILNLK